MGWGRRSARTGYALLLHRGLWSKGASRPLILFWVCPCIWASSQPGSSLLLLKILWRRSLSSEARTWYRGRLMRN